MSDWPTAIRDAEVKIRAMNLEIVKLKKRVAMFRQAVRIFKANIEDGVPWPCEEVESAKAGDAGQGKNDGGADGGF